MDVENAILECVDEERRQDAHVPGKTDQIDALVAQDRNDLAIVLFTFTSAAFDDDCLDSALAGDLETFRVALIADHDGDLGVWNCAVSNRVGERNHVRPAARD